MFLRIYRSGGGKNHFRYFVFDDGEMLHRCSSIHEMRIWLDLHGITVDASSPSDWKVHRSGFDVGWEDSTDIGSIVCVNLRLKERK